MDRHGEEAKLHDVFRRQDMAARGPGLSLPRPGVSVAAMMLSLPDIRGLPTCVRKFPAVQAAANTSMSQD
jgi:hypothetical protein